MSATIGRLITTGLDWTNTCSKPGTVKVEAQANTFETFVTSKVNADGSGSVTIERKCGDDRRTLVEIDITPETGEPRVTLQFDKSLESRGCELRNGRSVQIWSPVKVDRPGYASDLFPGGMRLSTTSRINSTTD